MLIHNYSKKSTKTTSMRVLEIPLPQHLIKARTLGKPVASNIDFENGEQTRHINNGAQKKPRNERTIITANKFLIAITSLINRNNTTPSPTYNKNSYILAPIIETHAYMHVWPPGRHATLSTCDNNSRLAPLSYGTF